MAPGASSEKEHNSSPDQRDHIAGGEEDRQPGHDLEDTEISQVPAKRAVCFRSYVLSNCVNTITLELVQSNLATEEACAHRQNSRKKHRFYFPKEY